MSRSIFGWDYPPGVNSVPGDDPDPPCEVCGKDPAICICPECLTCGEYGRTSCYLEGKLELSIEQVKGLEELLDAECRELYEDARYYSKMEEELDG
jgi:hypothetical protein